MRNSRAVKLAGDVLRIYLKRHVSRASAGLAYFLMLTVFPTLICLYEMLGSLFPATDAIEELIGGLLPVEMVETIVEYIGYVSLNSSHAMLTAAILAMATSSAAAFRTLHGEISEIMGVARRAGAFSFVFSFLFSLVFLAAVYFAVIVMLTGSWFLSLADERIAFLNISESWRWARFLLLFFLLLVIIYGIYRAAGPRESPVSVAPGSVFAAATMVGVSMLFSYFIGMSARYPLVYGSLASVIILLLWLYVCGNVIFIGCILNFALPLYY